MHIVYTIKKYSGTDHIDTLDINVYLNVLYSLKTLTFAWLRRIHARTQNIPDAFWKHVNIIKLAIQMRLCDIDSLVLNTNGCFNA